MVRIKIGGLEEKDKIDNKMLVITWRKEGIAFNIGAQEISCEELIWICKLGAEYYEKLKKKIENERRKT